MTRAPRGVRNNNPGNIRFIADPLRAWDGQIGDDGDGYGVYDTTARGIRAMREQLLKYQRGGLNAIDKIISKWAPRSENKTAAYIKAVCNALKVQPDEVIDVRMRMLALVKAIIHHECGQLPYSDVELEDWLNRP